MAGYIRQSTFTTDDVIIEGDHNSEYNQLLAAFDVNTGHKHDGTTAEGPVIGLIGDPGITTPLNKVEVDDATNTINFYTDESSTSVKKIIYDGDKIYPVTTETFDLGDATHVYNEVFTTDVTIGGTINIDSQTITNVTVDDSLTTVNDNTLVTSEVVKNYITNNYQATDPILDDLAGLSDPGADRILFWDEVSADGLNWLEVSTGLTLSGTTIVADFNNLVEDTTPVLGGNLDGAAYEVSNIKFKDYSVTVNAIGSTGGGTQDVDLELGNAVSMTVDTSANTLTVSNPTATGNECQFTMYLTNPGSQTLNLPASFVWDGGVVPTWTVSGVDIIQGLTIDGGTTWYCSVIGQAFS